MASNSDLVKKLRELTGAGILDCQKALKECGSDIEKSIEYLRQKGLAAAQKKAGRETNEGLVDSYIHPGNRIGVLVEVNCETDFVAKTEEFKMLVKDITLHIASMNPRWVTRDDVPRDILDGEARIFEAQAKESGKPENVIPRIIEGKLEAFYKDNVLLDQAFVKDDSKSVGAMIDENSSKLGEKIVVGRFARYKLGEGAEQE